MSRNHLDTTSTPESEVMEGDGVSLLVAAADSSEDALCETSATASGVRNSELEWRGWRGDRPS